MLVFIFKCIFSWTHVQSNHAKEDLKTICYKCHREVYLPPTITDLNKYNFPPPTCCNGLTCCGQYYFSTLSKTYAKFLIRHLMKNRQIWPQYLIDFPIFSSTSFLESVTPSYKKFVNFCFRQSACSNTGTATVRNTR